MALPLCWTYLELIFKTEFHPLKIYHTQYFPEGSRKHNFVSLMFVCFQIPNSSLSTNFVLPLYWSMHELLSLFSGRNSTHHQFLFLPCGTHPLPLHVSPASPDF